MLLFIRVWHSGHKLFEMVGRAWIIDLHNISEHFAFWARSLTSLEIILLIFFSIIRQNTRHFFWKQVFGHNFWLECPTDERSTFLSYIFDALFQKKMPCILHYNAKKIRDTISRLVRDLAQKAKSSEILRRSRIQHLQVWGGDFVRNVSHHVDISIFKKFSTCWMFMLWL